MGIKITISNHYQSGVYEDQGMLFFSEDYGRTWPQRVPVPVSGGCGMYTEGDSC